MPDITPTPTGERVARAICKAKGINPDMCTMGSSGLSFVDDKPVYYSNCWRYAWQEELGIAYAAIDAMAKPPRPPEPASTADADLAAGGE